MSTFKCTALMPLSFAALAITAAAAAEPMKISLGSAITQALREGPAAQLADEQVSSSRAVSHRARAALLPQLGVDATAGNQSVNLELYGFHTPQPVVPPFDVFEGRITARLAVLDLAAIQRYHALRMQVAVSEAERRRVRSEAAAAVARLYVGLLKAQAQVAQSEATVQLFDKVLGAARRQRDAGMAARRDAMRAEIQLNQQRSLLLAARQRRDEAKRALLEVMGADLGADVATADELAPDAAAASTKLTLPDLVQTARMRRPEMQSAREQKRAADAAAGAVQAERLPSIHAEVHAEQSGNSPSGLASTRGGAVRVSLPLFTGGRIGAELGEARARQRAAQIREQAAARLVERQVRDAVASIEAARERVGLAVENARLTAEELDSAQNRVGAGVAPGIEVDNAQTTYASAREELVAAQADLAQARIDLDFATGRLAAESGDAGSRQRQR
jgi:outer membrane protein TolC